MPVFHPIKKIRCHLTGIVYEYIFLIIQVPEADGRRWMVMRKWASIFLALAISISFSYGCAGVSKDAKVRCPKCGVIFTVDEGLSEMQRKGW